MRIFVREVEIALKLLVVVSLVTAYLTTLAWGFDQRREAERWRVVACRSRLQVVERATRIVRVSTPGALACETLDRLGLPLEGFRAVGRP